MMLRQTTGTLVVFAFQGDQANPVAGAKVTISNANGNVIATTQTDESGQTEAVSLSAPEKSLSLAPFNGVPYSRYNITIEATGFNSAEIKGVQIFEDTEAVQPIGLTPTLRSNSRQSVEEVTITEHNLLLGESKLSEEKINEEVPTKFFMLVSGRTKVPSHIIVHDGHPNDASKPNYEVPFKSYITNVACSEIFPTWPIEAIKANVACIISFTLNRLKTEFYFGKGKQFQITSSTAYDHKYIHKRNIYANVSNIVDNMFSEFISISSPDEGEFPFLTQYCDGRRVRCPGWLSQWDSKERADRGENYVQILKHFYGDQVQLKQAEEVEGIEKSFPGTSLRKGSSGDEVRNIQRYLNRIAKNYPAIKTVTEDEVFGPETEEQVKRFQKIFKLGQTGVVDYATWYKISDIYVAVTKLAEGPSGGPRMFVSNYSPYSTVNQRSDYNAYTLCNTFDQGYVYCPFILCSIFNRGYDYYPFIPCSIFNQSYAYTPYTTGVPMPVHVVQDPGQRY